MKNVKNALSAIAMPLTVLLGVVAIIWYMSTAYTQCIDDGNTPTACRMILTGGSIVMNPEAPHGR